MTTMACLLKDRIDLFLEVNSILVWVRSCCFNQGKYDEAETDSDQLSQHDYPLFASRPISFTASRRLSLHDTEEAKSESPGSTEWRALKTADVSAPQIGCG